MAAVDRIIGFVVGRILSRPEEAFRIDLEFHFLLGRIWPAWARYIFVGTAAACAYLGQPLALGLLGAPLLFALLVFSYGRPQLRMTQDAEDSVVDSTDRPERAAVADMVASVAAELGLPSPRFSYITWAALICGAGLDGNGVPWVMVSSAYVGSCEGNAGCLKAAIAHELGHVANHDRANTARAKWLGLVGAAVVTTAGCTAIALAMPGGPIAALAATLFAWLTLRGSGGRTPKMMENVTARLVTAYLGRRMEFRADRETLRFIEPAAYADHLATGQSYGELLYPLEMIYLEAALETASETAGETSRAAQICRDLEAALPMSRLELSEWLSTRDIEPEPPASAGSLKSRLARWWDSGVCSGHPSDASRVARLTKLKKNRSKIKPQNISAP